MKIYSLADKREAKAQAARDNRVSSSRSDAARLRYVKNLLEYLTR